MSRIVTSSLFVLLTLGAACGPKPAPEDLTASENEEDISVRIVSHNFNNVVIFLYVGESRQRLGIAGGNSTTDFTIPWRRVASNRKVRLFGEMIGASRVHRITGNPEQPVMMARPPSLDQQEQMRDQGLATNENGEITSDSLQLNPGARVVWTIEARLDQSMVAVF